MLAETNGTAAGTTREYIWLPEVEIAPADGARSQVDRPIAVVNAVNTATPATWYVSVDHLNRPIQMTDAAKASVWAAVWQASWLCRLRRRAGGVHSITGTASLDARLPGQWFQAETGLHYNWHRQYDPTVGRYTQPDPLGFVDGPSLYAYVRGLPQGLVDKDGRASQSLAGPAFGIGTAVCGPACGAGAAAATVVGAAIIYYCLKTDPCKEALKQCNIAANGSEDDWNSFCTASTYQCRIDRSRPGRCYRKLVESRQNKRNWCVFEFGD